jgi:hypothetical protein
MHVEALLLVGVRPLTLMRIAASLAPGLDLRLRIAEATSAVSKNCWIIEIC